MEGRKCEMCTNLRTQQGWTILTYLLIFWEITKIPYLCIWYMHAHLVHMCVICVHTYMCSIDTRVCIFRHILNAWCIIYRIYWIYVYVFTYMNTYAVYIYYMYIITCMCVLCVCEYTEYIKCIISVLTLVVRWYRICLQCGRAGFSPWVGRIPWRRAWQHQLPCILAWRIPWTEEPGGAGTPERLSIAHSR